MVKRMFRRTEKYKKMTPKAFFSHHRHHRRRRVEKTVSPWPSTVSILHLISEFPLSLLSPFAFAFAFALGRPRCALCLLFGHHPLLSRVMEVGGKRQTDGEKERERAIMVSGGLRSVWMILLLASHSAADEIKACLSPLGLESGSVSSSQLSASSSHDELSVGPDRARLNRDDAGGAWCPRATGRVESDSRHHLQVDLLRPVVLTGVQTQGRLGQGHGKEFAEAYSLEYWRPGMADFRPVMDAAASVAIFSGNSNTQEVVTNMLGPPVVASAVRILPRPSQERRAATRTPCLRLELLGCDFVDGLVSYSASPSPHRGQSSPGLWDVSYDGKTSSSARLSGGLGQLVDGVTGSTVEGMHDAIWVGWKNSDPLSPTCWPVDLQFNYSSLRALSFVTLHLHPADPSLGVGMLKSVVLRCGDGEEEKEEYLVEEVGGHGKLVLEAPQNCTGRSFRLRICFRRKWMLLSEVELTSAALSESNRLEKQQPVPTEKAAAPTATSNTSSWLLGAAAGAGAGAAATSALLALALYAAASLRRWCRRRRAVGARRMRLQGSAKEEEETSSSHAGLLEETSSSSGTPSSNGMASTEPIYSIPIGGFDPDDGKGDLFPAISGDYSIPHSCHDHRGGGGGGGGDGGGDGDVCDVPEMCLPPPCRQVFLCPSNRGERLHLPLPLPRPPPLSLSSLQPPPRSSLPFPNPVVSPFLPGYAMDKLERGCYYNAATSSS